MLALEVWCHRLEVMAYLFVIFIDYNLFIFIYMSMYKDSSNIISKLIPDSGPDSRIHSASPALKVWQSRTVSGELPVPHCAKFFLLSWIFISLYQWWKIITWSHRLTAICHPGTQRIYCLLKVKYCCSNMIADIPRFVTLCVVSVQTITHNLLAGELRPLPT